MAKPISKIHQACREVWKRALHAPVHIKFETAKEAARAKFTFYDSVRREKRTGEGDPEILKAAANVELALSKDKCTIIARQRTENPFYGDLHDRLQEALGQMPAGVSEEEAEVSDSLKKLQASLEESEPEAGENKPDNPYYKRGEL